MKKVFRFIFKTILWLLVLLIVAAVAAYYYLGSIVKEAVTRFVPPVTGTTAVVEHVDLSLLSGHIEIRGLEIGNPKGYSDNNIFELGKITVDFEPKSVLSDKIIIKAITIADTKVSAELKNVFSLENNVATLQQNVENYLGTDKKKADKTPAKKEQAEASSGGKTVVVKDLKITGTEVAIGANGQTMSVTLPEIHQQNIGEKSKEQTIGDVIAYILDCISVESVKAIAKSGKEFFDKTMEQTASQIKAGAAQMKNTADAVKSGAKDTAKAVKDSAGAVKDGAKGAVDGLKGLFK